MDLINQYSALLQSQKAVEMASQGSLGGDSYLQLPPEAAGLNKEELKALAGQIGAKVERLLAVLRSGDPMQVANYHLEAQQAALQDNLNQQKTAEAAAKANPKDESLAREAEVAKKAAEMQRARVAPPACSRWSKISPFSTNPPWKNSSSSLPKREGSLPPT